ncbi:hypothetical protein OG788_46770 [Streptomyces sp. NBC_00647]|uniref:hypothetical protein n=1 Tax=Streptomyces sp. NBC_00647 TaxID=2975796 RepID=UPI0032465C2D
MAALILRIGVRQIPCCLLLAAVGSAAYSPVGKLTLQGSCAFEEARGFGLLTVVRQQGFDGGLPRREVPPGQRTCLSEWQQCVCDIVPGSKAASGEPLGQCKRLGRGIE